MVSSGKILLTTSRNPTPKIRTFCNDLTRVIPKIVRVNRGKMSLDEIAEKALEQGADKVIIIDRWEGGPGKIQFFCIGESGLVRFPPILYVVGIRLQREFALTRLKPVHSLAITSTVDNSMQLADSLSKFLNFPLLIENETLLKYQVAMYISKDATRRVQTTFMLLPQKLEVGPRITIRRVEWEATK